jgi:integrase
MSVRKRKWTTTKGEVKEAWICDVGVGTDRHIKTFERKADAVAYEAQTNIDVRAGVHVSPAKSPTVAQAGQDWIKASEAKGLERSTLKQYREHTKIHINPILGELKLAEVNTPTVRKFEIAIRERGTSPALTKMVLTSLHGIFAEAVEHGRAAQNPVRGLRKNRKSDRKKTKLKVGVDVPTPEEVGRIIETAPRRWRPLFIVAAFTGLRSSELRGLRWSDVDIDGKVLKVEQRADRFQAIGDPKSAAGRRHVPFGPIVANTLREWKLACPKGEMDLVFPNSEGKIDWHANIAQRGFIPTVEKALGKPAKYTGLHCLRHFYASWCIDRGIAPKVIQERMGHSSITITFDRYGHLFPRDDDVAEIEAAELSVVNATQMRHRG